METNIYKSKSIPNAYIFIPAGAEPSSLPKQVLSKLGELTYLKK